MYLQLTFLLFYWKTLQDNSQTIGEDAAIGNAFIYREIF